MARNRTPRVTVFLDRQHAAPNGWLTILFRVNFANGEKDLNTGKYITPKRIQFSTGFRSTETLFDAKTRRVKRNHPAAMALNAYLDRLEGQTYELWLQAVTNGLDPYGLMQEIFRGPVQAPPQRLTFIRQLQHFIDSFEQQYNVQPRKLRKFTETAELPKKQQADQSAQANSASSALSSQTYRTRSSATVKNYKKLLRYLLQFQQHMGYELDYHHLNNTFRDQFAAYLEQCDCANNYSARLFERLKAIVREFRDKDFHSETAFAKWAKIENTTPPNEFALTETELQAIQHLQLEPGSKLAHAQNKLLLMASTGIRISDVAELVRENVFEHKGRHYLQFMMKKTKQTVTIPLSKQSPVLRILEQYNYKLPKMKDSDFNSQLKQLALMAGVTATFQDYYYVGTKRKEYVNRKCDKIASHTARRTFATLAFYKGMNLKHIQAVLGHKTMLQTEEYIKSTVGFIDVERFEAIDALDTATVQQFEGV